MGLYSTQPFVLQYLSRLLADRKVGLWVFLFSIFLYQSHAQVTSTAAGGNWSAGSTWVGGVAPAAGQSVTIAGPVSVDINTPTVNNVTVNAGSTLTIQNIAASTMTYNGNLVVCGTLINNGGIVQASSTNKTFQLCGTGTYIHNPRNLTLIDESIFSKSNEVFSNTSNLVIQKWFDVNIALGSASRVQQPITFGNVTLNIPDVTPWEQDNQFMDPADNPRILGTLTVSSGVVRMDDGSAMSTFMQFNDIIINGTGSIIFLSGAPRPFVLMTNNFTDVSTSANPTMIMDNVFGLTQWNVNGNLTLGHNFYGIVGTGVNPGGSMTVAVSGNLNITGGSVQFVSAASAPLTLTVSGNTTFSGNPTRIRFVDGNLGNLNFTTNNFTISAGGDNVLMGGNGLVPQATGIPNILINNDLIVNGASNTTILDASNTTQKLRLRIGHDFIINGVNSNFTAARSNGALTVHVSNNCTLSAGKFIGQIDTLNSSIDSVFIGGHFLMNSTTATDYFRINYGTGNTFFRSMGNFTLSSTGNGQGIGFTGVFSNTANMNFQVTGIFTMSNGRFSGIYNSKPWLATGNLTFTVSTNFNLSNGFFRGIDNRVSANTGIVNFTVGNLNYSGGNFSGFYSVHTAAGTANFTINGLLQITFNTAATDTFMFIGYTSIGPIVSNLKLNVTVAGNMNITGANGAFISSIADGRETINITGSLNSSGGKNSFNSFPGSGLPNPHPVILTIGGDLAAFGGSLYLSAHNDSLVATVNGNLTVSNGELVIQGGNTPAILDVLGGFNQTGGNLFFHKNSIEFSYSLIQVTINSDNNLIGDFSHTAGTINFDNNTQSTQVFFTINSPNITYGGTGVMTMANPGTNLIAGILRYGRDGNAYFSRTSATHSIQQIEQHLLSGCTLIVVSGNLQIASYNNITTNMLLINSGSVLDLQNNQVFSNALQANSGFKLFGRLRTSRPQGFYDGTTNAAINSTGNMDFFILTNSVVEYYGTNTQVVTGIGVGTALFSPHKYYNLEINNTGTPNVNFAYPTNIPNGRSVFVKNKLTLVAGELNLDNDRNPSGGGRSIIIERDSLTAITRINGYIRSEVYDSSASVIWRVNSRTGPRIIPFGFDATNYIPFTFDLASGNADTLFVSTYRTNAANMPYPPPVTHVNGLTGTDNSANTVDRFWYIRSTGTSTNANLRFICTPSELGSIPNPRAQCWILNAPTAWQFPWQGTQSTVTNGTYVVGADYYPNNWWTLAGMATPLPVSFLDLDASCDGELIQINWVTGSEHNNQLFSVLKSFDGINYETIGSVPGAGNSSSVLRYQFTDREPAIRITYYKIAQTDFDGRTTHFGPVLASPCKSVNQVQVSVIPTNPDELSVIIKNPENDRFQIRLIGMDGKLITVKDAVLESGINLITLNTSGLSTGIYFVQVNGSNSSNSTKIPIGHNR
jgi:hypothetical protein